MTTTLPTCNWEVVFGATNSFMQDVCQKNFDTNTQMKSALDQPPDISLNNSNQIVFNCNPKKYEGSYNVYLNLSTVSVTPVPDDGTTIIPDYQMCFTTANGKAPFEVSALSGGTQASATEIQNNLNNSVSGKCLELTTSLRRDDEAVEIGPTAKALLEKLAPQYMAFASLVDSANAPLNQLLAPFMSTSPNPPAGDPFTSFAGSTALSIPGNNATSTCVYAILDYFLLNDLVKPKIVSQFGFSDGDVVVSNDEPAVLSVIPAIHMNDSLTLNNFKMHVGTDGFVVSAGCTLVTETNVGDIPVGATLQGDLTITLASTPDNSTNPPTIGFEVVNVEATFEDDGVAKLAAAIVAGNFFEAMGGNDVLPPISYLYYLLALIVFAVMYALTLLAIANMGETPQQALDQIQAGLNEQLADMRRTMKEGVSIDKVLYDYGTINFLTIDPYSFAPAAAETGTAAA